MKDGESSRCARKKKRAVLGIEIDVARVFRSIADRGDMTCICIDGDELVVFTCSKELSASFVDGESGWAGARCQLPGRCYFFCGGVDESDFTECRERHEDIPFTVGHRRAGASAKRDGCNDVVGCGIDDGGAVA